MAKKILTTPIQKSDLEGIKPGDVIYLTGHITTTRGIAGWWKKVKRYQLTLKMVLYSMQDQLFVL